MCNTGTSGSQGTSWEDDDGKVLRRPAVLNFVLVLQEILLRAHYFLELLQYLSNAK